jgi:arabinose-5-phosphate isomerase
MLTGNKIPFISENAKMDKVIKLINEKKLGVVIVRNKKLSTSGIFTDGDIKRTIQINKKLQEKTIKSYMTKKPISIDKDMLAENALEIMNEKKITCICVHKNSNKKKTIGVLHIHHLINAEIS